MPSSQQQRLQRPTLLVSLKTNQRIDQTPCRLVRHYRVGRAEHHYNRQQIRVDPPSDQRTMKQPPICRRTSGPEPQHLSQLTERTDGS